MRAQASSGLEHFCSRGKAVQCFQVWTRSSPAGLCLQAHGQCVGSVSPEKEDCPDAEDASRHFTVRTPSEKWLAMKVLESYLDKLDNEKDLIQNDLAALYCFHSKHFQFPKNDILVVLFIQVRNFLIWDQQHLLMLPQCHCDLQGDPGRKQGCTNKDKDKAKVETWRFTYPPEAET
ncbi:hypothetical protein Celaphus_00018748 [Cervus elaphus hippelaphus]|uniref:Uncharacterized protein n=1 Tax=Cervus elaphus hippelaphus TaxID=46360 RepID=A0A212C5M5_CEREH|nr:hypothetical protein Celaphus_00018748 [Cervus elaphus hippelaphus]